MPTLLYVPRFDENGAGPRYRVYQYIDSFKQLGIQIEVKPLFNITYLNKLYFKNKRSLFFLLQCYIKRALFLFFNKNKYDLVLMDGELFPFVPYFIEKFFLPKRYIIDQDDAIFHTYDNHRSSWVRMLLGKKIDKVWKNSHHLIIGNDYIKQIAMQMGVKNVTALPTAVNADKYKPLANENYTHDEIVIGWVGSPTTVGAFELIKTALINVAKQRKIKVAVIGANYHIDGVKTVCTDWKQGWSEEEEIRLTNEIDIGIMPLKDGPYEKGKGGFKLIKYMATAKPMIASPVGMNCELVDHGENGFLAATQQDWEKYLLMLIDDSELRNKMGHMGRNKMVEKYSFQSISPVLCNIVMQSFV